ncbi:MAG: patatin-like phospholipase family protein [bacterium]|nr:patatin-like phospholipase family protein [bacterium]
MRSVVKQGMSLRLILPAFLLFSSALIHAAESVATRSSAPVAAKLQKKTTRPRVALVLSGGGARGIAHIGVFKALEKMRVPYDCIVGTSMGAIAGGSFATGFSVAEAENKVVNADWSSIFADRPQRSDIPYFRKSEDYQPYFDFTLTLNNFNFKTPRNFVGVQNIGLFFRELTGARSVASFDELPVPFRAIGTDIITGKPVLLSDGTVAEAMRASMTVPGVFPPIPYKGHLLVDGGLSKNIPVSTGRELCGDVVIAVNVSTPNLKQDQLVSFLNIGEQVINIGMQTNMSEELALLTPQDVLLVPDLDRFTGTDFQKASELVNAGEKVVNDHAEELKPLQVSEAEYVAWRDAIEARKPVLPVIDSVKMAPMKWVNKDVMSDLLKIHPGNDFDMESLHKNINRVYARGDFSSISYDIVNTAPGKADILITPEEKPGRDFVRFGLSLYSDFQGDASFSAIASLRRAWLNRLDAEWRADMQVGRDNALYSEWYQPASLGSELFVAPYAFFRDQHHDVRLTNVAKLDYEYQQEGGGLELGSVFGRWGEVRIGIMRAYATLKSTSLLTTPDENYQQGGYTLRSIYDQLDNTNFPHSGGSARLSYFKSSHDLDAAANYDRVEFRGAKALTWGRNTAFLAMRTGSSLGTALPFYDGFSLGGIFNLSAYPPDYFRGEELFSGRAMLYRRINDLPAGLGKGVYAGSLLEAGRITSTFNGYTQSNGSALSGGLFVAADTVLGPFYLLGALGNNNQAAVYMALGITF